MELRSNPRHYTILCFWIVSLLLPLAFVRVCYTYLYPLEARIEPPRAYAGTVQPNASNQVSDGVDLRQPQAVRDDTQRDSQGSWVEATSQGAQSVAEECDVSLDLAEGEWVFDSSGPRYTNDTCSFLPRDQDCLGNGKPFTDYLYWRWKPALCGLPLFDPTEFLKMMEGRVLAFVGDSIARNQWHSLMCLLAQVDKGSHIFRHYEDWKTSWAKFPSTNFTLVVMWAPYLLEYSLQPDNKPTQLHLDVLQESWTSVLPQFDVAVFSTGQWYFKPAVYYLANQSIGANLPTEQLLPQLQVPEIYRTALKTIFAGISAIPGYKGLSFWRTWAVEHFEGGTWQSGGSCPRRVPYKSNNSGFQDSYHSHFLDLQLQEFSNAGLHQSAVWDLLNVTSMSWLRPDGHSGPYRIPHPFAKGSTTPHVQHDCLHWCLPGPVDSWNDWLALKLRAHLYAA